MVFESAMICTNQKHKQNKKLTSGVRLSSVGQMALKSRSKKSEADTSYGLAMRGSSNWLRPQTYTLVALDLGKMKVRILPLVP